VPHERLDPERVREVLLQPPDRLRDPLGRGAGRGDLAQPRPLRAGEHAVGDLAEHERRQRFDVPGHRLEVDRYQKRLSTVEAVRFAREGPWVR
jgi:hypothetical protein